MDCRDCARHDAETGKCLDGKVNPRRYEHALGVVQVLGLRAICVFNDHRERLVGVHQLDGEKAKQEATSQINGTRQDGAPSPNGA